MIFAGWGGSPSRAPERDFALLGLQPLYIHESDETCQRWSTIVMPCHSGILHAADWTDSLRAQTDCQFSGARIHRVHAYGTDLPPDWVENAFQVAGYRFYENSPVQRI